MKKIILTNCIIIICFLLLPQGMTAQNKYIQRFIDQRAKIVDKNNGYFSPEGGPYHSIETLMCEAPDQGHESTSEAYSFWVWLEAMNGRVSGDWTSLNNAWSTLAKQIIPADSMQPTNNAYVNGGAKATYAAEYPLPSMYPSALDASVPVGTEPVSKELSTTYGTTSVYGMHWLLDADNFYGFGIKRAPNAKPAFINTFQRGEQESTWETVPQPCYDLLKWGGPNGFLDLFVKENGASAPQWKYTNAPDADARAIQAMYWATEWAKAQGKTASAVPAALASKMGDYLRLSFFDKYFKPIGCQNKAAAGATGYGSAHYLMSWYYAWGGPNDPSQNWAWRIGCSHSHFGYQNPLAAYALSNYADLIPKSPNAKNDWTTSLQRQLEFYRWLQSSEGAIAGGCTNMLNGNYSAYPAGTSTFYNMAYQANPVYHDPGSNTWFGMQAWSVERLAEYYYLTNNALAKQVLDKWVLWVRSVCKINADGTFSIPSEISWSGQPDTWNAANPGANASLHVTVVSSGTDLGITACTAKALTYYAAATRKYGTLDNNARLLAQNLLDGLYNNYWEGASGKGYGTPEERKDYRRFDSLVYVPAGWSGKMPNGDIIQPGVTFLDIRSKYKNDPLYPAMRSALSSGQVFKTTFHRFWAQADIALANAEYGYFFGDSTVNVPVTTVTVAPTTASVGIGATTTLVATVLPSNATNKSVTWSTSNATIATVSSTGVVTGVALGSATITVTTVDGAKTATCTVTVSNVPVTGVTVSPTTASIAIGGTSQLTATVLPANATNKNVTWKSSNTAVATVSSTGLVTGVAAGTATITVTTVDGAKAATCAVTVTNVPVTSVSVNPTTASLAIGATTLLTATVLPANATNKSVTWTTSNAAFATVGATGLVTGVAAGTATMTVTTVDGAKTATCSVTVGSTSCSFGTPLATALPTLNASYNKVYVLGTGPNLSNVTNCTINWDLSQNGLWQLSFNTNNGVPTWWIDLRSVATWKFNQVQPEITFTNSGFTGLNGAYWVTKDGSNLVLVSKTGGFTIYFSNSATAPVCTKSAKVEPSDLVNGQTAISVYPNPFTNKIALQVSNAGEVKSIIIANQLGSLVKVLDASKFKNNQIEFGEELPAGIYLIKVRDKEGTKTFKVIKK